MKRSRFSDEQILRVLKEVEEGEKVKAVCARHNISEGTYFTWKRKYGGMDVEAMRRLKALEEANARLKRLVADLSVLNQIFKEVNSKKW
jgi:putative transposase